MTNAHQEFKKLKILEINKSLRKKNYFGESHYSTLQPGDTEMKREEARL